MWISSRRRFLKMAVAAGTPVASGQDFGSQGRAIYLSDMSQCRPQAALSRKPRRHHWRLLDYEADSIRGTMLVAGQNTAAPELSYPLAQKGWYAIYFGLRSYGGEDQTRLQVRLKSDSTFSLIVHHTGERNRLDEYFWRCADLTGEEIVLRQLTVRTVPESAESPANASSGVWLAYIRLVPVVEAEVKTQPETRRLFAHNDAWSYTFTFRPTTEAEIRRELEPFRDTDFSRIYWKAGMGDRMYYPTKLGLTPADDWIEDPYRAGDRLAAETWQSWRKQRIDPFRVALDYAHKLGLEFHANYRVAGFHFPVPEDEWNTGGAYDKHPEWRGQDRAGHPTPRLSYAHPGVRRMAIGFLKEMKQYPIDGICLAYNRRPSLVEYEAPIVEGFRAKFGEDPRRIEERDPRWLSYRATFLTEFMREARRYG